MLTVGSDTLEGLLQQVQPMRIQSVQPRGLLQCLKVVSVLVRVLRAHHLEALEAQVGQVLAVLASRLLERGRIGGRHYVYMDERYSTEGENQLRKRKRKLAGREGIIVCANPTESD